MINKCNNASSSHTRRVHPNSHNNKIMHGDVDFNLIFLNKKILVFTHLFNPIMHCA